MFIKQLMCISLIVGTAFSVHATRTFNQALNEQFRRSESYNSQKQKKLNSTNPISLSEGNPTLSLLFLGLLASGGLINVANAESYVPPSNSSGLSHGQMNKALENFKGGALEITHALQHATMDALNGIFCSPTNPNCLVLESHKDKKNSQIKCVGSSREDVHSCLDGFNNFNRIRETVLPPTPQHGKTQSHAWSTMSFTDILTSLGLNKNDIESAQLIECNGLEPKCQALSAPIPEPFVVIKYSGHFNTQIAQLLLKTLSEESPFFDYLTRTVNSITIHNGYLFISYPVFWDYLGHLQASPISYDTTLKKYVASFPLEQGLKRVIAAVGGNLALHEQETGHTFIATISLGDTRTQEEKVNNPLEMKIILDNSGSMDGNPIDTINREIPSLLEQIKGTLRNQTIKISFYAINSSINNIQEITLNSDTILPRWQPLSTEGGTDLTLIGPFVDKKKGAPYTLLVVFTDGQHNLRKLDKHIELLEQIQARGEFAHLFLCKIGYGDEKYFNLLNEIFAGSYLKGSNAASCINHIIGSLHQLLLPKNPIVLTIDGQNRVIWTEDSPGIHTTEAPVKDGDSIKFKGRDIVIETTKHNDPTSNN